MADSILDPIDPGAGTILSAPAVGSTKPQTLQAASPSANTQAATPTQLPAPVTYRRMGDTAATRAAIYDNTFKAVSTLQPITNKTHSLSLHDVHWADPETFSLKDQKLALLSGQSLSRRLRGTWVLKDLATDQEVERKTTQVARVPFMTDRGTFISSGAEMSLANQMRLRPGIYTRRQENGLLSSHINPQNGFTHKIFMDPATGIFKIAMSQAEMPLYPVLRGMGVSDKQMREAWGDEITNSNLRKDDPQVIKKLHAKLLGKQKPVEGESVEQAVIRAFGKMNFDPAVTKRTLGHEHTTINGDTMMAVTKKLLAVHRNEADVDDRDAMAYQTVHGPEDLISERVGKAKQLLTGLLWKSANKKRLTGGLTNAFDEPLRAALLFSGLGQNLEEVNLAEVLDQQSRITKLGQGGIESRDAIPMESRGVHPSHFGFIDPIRTSESLSVGVDLRLAGAVRKGSDGKPYIEVTDKQGNKVYKAPDEITDSVVAFPGEMETNRPFVKALVNNQLHVVPREDVEFIAPHAEHTMSALSNLVPAKSAMKGQRVSMASRMLTQALPLKSGEAPWVQAADPDSPDRSFAEIYGEKMGAVRAHTGGRVMSVTPDEMTVRYDDGTEKTIELMNNLPLNRKTLGHQTPLVGAGERFDPGQLIVRSNHTDNSGAMALGANARVAYIPWEGNSYEDAMAISESFAKKLQSEHMYKHDHEWTDTDKRGKANFVGVFPQAYSKAVMDNFDDHGVIKPGTIVKANDPLILVAAEQERNQKALVRGDKPVFKDKSVKWEHSYDGVVTDVVHGDSGPSVVVKAYASTELADKLSGLHGNKGVIGTIIPDEEMPIGEDGRPFEVLMNPMGLASRVNPSQLLETALGKIAEKTGKPYKLRDFDTLKDLREHTLEELKQHGLKPSEHITDVRTGRIIPDVFTGNQWFMKLHHSAEGKLQGRGLGAYQSDGTPGGGNDESDTAKRLGMLETSALLSSGASHVLRESKLLRGQANPQYWSQYMSGYNPADPEVPFQYKKFLTQLQAAGIHPVSKGTKTHLTAMTDKIVDELAGDRELQNAETVDWKDMSPVKGGLFDPALSGGHGTSSGGGNRWSKITLHNPLPSPAFEEPIRRVLGLTKQKFEDILSSKAELNGATGPQALHDALKKINVDQAINRARMDLNSGKRTLRDGAIKQLGYLKAAQKAGVHPSEWMITKVPVIPPLFRPVSVMGNNGIPLVDDANILYKDLFNANKMTKELAKHLDPKDYGEETLGTYNALKAVTGLGDPVQAKNKERNVKGILKHVFGASPKYGTVQRKLLGSTVDFVSRGVLIPQPDFHMDQIGVPEAAAWSMARPLVIRRLVEQGVPRLEAAKQVQQKTPLARKALQEEFDDGVVVQNRAPSWHRYNVVANKPVLVKGHAIQVSPLTLASMAGDADGDAINLHMLVGAEAKKEALAKLLPSKNLLDVAGFKVHQVPAKEFVAGLYHASTAKDDKKLPQHFASTKDVWAAFKAGKLDLGQQVSTYED